MYSRHYCRQQPQVDQRRFPVNDFRLWQIGKKTGKEDVEFFLLIFYLLRQDSNAKLNYIFYMHFTA